jgi:hypothetical protein
MVGAQSCEAVVRASEPPGQRTREIEMIRASVQLRDDSNAFSVTVRAAVRAENLQRAVELAAKRYPGLTVGLRFPLDPESFFVEGSSLGMETSGLITGYRDLSRVETRMP